MEPDCINVGFWGVPRCNFEPRYDLIPPVMGEQFSKISTTVGGMETMIQALTKKVYVRDVCTSCGKTIERPDEMAAAK